MTAEPRVFHLITRLLRGGAEAKTIQTVLGVDGYDFTVGYGADYDPGQVQRLAAAGIDTQRFASLRHYNPVTAVAAVGAVARYLRHTEVDIVHTHSTEAGIVGRFAASLADVPAVVHTVHGVPFTADRNAALSWFVLQCERAAARRTDRLVTNADAIAAEYLHRGIGTPDQYTTIYSGIDIARFRNATPAPDVTGDGVRVVTVGRLVDGKGFEELLAAVDRLHRDDVSVYLVGEGPLRETLQTTIARRGLSDSVHLLGYRDDVPAVLAACDVFVLPSYREGTPRVITEAMAAGLPVIATDIAGIPEQVEDGTNGRLVQPGDVDALVAALETLVESPERRAQFGAASRERVERFSREAMLADVDALYRDLLAGG